MTTYKNFKITANLQGAEINKTRGDSKPHNKYFVYVTNTETGAKTRFTFWDSLHNTESGIVLDGDELLSAFYCFLSDAYSAGYDFGAFCDEFGYDEDSRSAERVYKMCCKAYEKWERVAGLTDDEFIEFFDELQEIAG